MTQKDKKAKLIATTIEEIIKEKEQYKKARDKRQVLKKEDLISKKNDPLNKKVLNFIKRYGIESRVDLYNAITDHFEKKSLKQARSVASEIIRNARENINPKESAESQLEKLTSMSSIKQDVKDRIKRKEKYPEDFSRGGLTRTGHTDYRKTGIFK
tara:strand:- start:84 stop:551 length:468 start_codon:yes stop_codon:yes gene_type:complete